MQFAEDRVNIPVFIYGKMRRQIAEQPAAFRFRTIGNTRTGRAGIGIAVIQGTRYGSVFEVFPAPLRPQRKGNIVFQKLKRRCATDDTFKHEQ